MKRFECFLSGELEQYIQYRASFGYSDTHHKCYLHRFDRYIVINKKNSTESLTAEFFLSFIKQFDLAPCTINKMISAVRDFFSYLQRIDVIEKNPLTDIVPLPEQSYVPYIFSENNSERLLKAMYRQIRKDKMNFLRDYEVYMIILLMVRCGLRISEPLNLETQDYHACEGTIYIRKTKFNKNRLIPVPESALQELSNYISIRDSLRRNQNKYMFPGIGQFRIGRNFVCSAFHNATEAIGVANKKKLINNVSFGKTTSHSLRHSFAINTLKRIKARGESPQNALPFLSTYMGHAKYQYTAVYLKALDAAKRKGLFEITSKFMTDI